MADRHNAQALASHGDIERQEEKKRRVSECKEAQKSGTHRTACRGSYEIRMR